MARPPFTGRSSRLRGAALAGWMAVSLGAAVGRSSEQAPAPQFFDAYSSARAAAARAPDSILEVADRALARDADDFLGAWLRGRFAPFCRDSQRAIARVSGDTSVSRPGHWVTRAALEVGRTALRVGRGTPSHARAAYHRAASAYEATGRLEDASRAILFAGLNTFSAADSIERDREFALAESLARRSGDPAAIADALLAQAADDFDVLPANARARREEAVRLLLPLGASRQLSRAHRGLANVLKFAGDLEGAEREYQAALAVATELRDAQLTAQALGGLGNIQRARAEFGAALESHARALELARKGGSRSTLLARVMDLCTLELQLGHVRESREYLDEAERLSSSAPGDAGERLHLLDQRASLEALAGRFDTARARLDSAVILATRAGPLSAVPNLRLHQAAIARDLGEVDEAERLASLGIAVAKQVGHRRAEITLRVFRAELLHSSGRPREALAAARELREACAVSDPRQLGFAVRVESGALADLGRTSEALARLKRERARLDSLGASLGDSLDLGRTLALEAAIHLERGEVSAADRLSREAYGLMLASGDTASAFDAARLSGEAALMGGRPREAIRRLRPALAYENRVSSSLRSSGDRSGHRSGWYEGAVALAASYVGVGELEQGLLLLEGTRARELRRLLLRRSSGLRAHVSAALADEVERAEIELEALQNLRVRGPASDAPAARDLARLDARLDALKDRHAALMQQVERASPLYGAASATAAPMRISAMQQALQVGDEVHFFMVGPRRTVIWRLDRGNLRARVLAVGEHHWAARIDGLVAKLQAGLDRRVAVAGLGDTLLGTLEPVAGTRRVHVVPDGPLHALPFDALEVEVRGAGRRALIEVAETAEAPSAAWLFAPSPPRVMTAASADVAAFGDPDLGAAPSGAPSTTRGADYPGVGRLANAQREVEAIRDAFPNARLYRGREASESRFIEECGRASIVHVAAHGFVDDRRPAYSGLALAADRRDGRLVNDGLVQAFELADASIGAELATLSACESGAGTLRRGEGLQGLARAFQIAGARNLLVSLWRVEDAETADLMTTFYRALAAGAAPATALRTTKLEAMRRHAVTPEASGAMRGVGTRASASRGAAAATWPAFVLLGRHVMH